MTPTRADVSKAGEALSAALDAFAAAGIEEPRLDAEVLLAEASRLDRAALVANPGAELSAPAARRFSETVRRRLRREPVAYILGRRGFRHLELAVDRRVLVPRPETELLVEVALERRPARVLDVGTGSGAIALAIADELPGCEVTATDASAAALEVARANAERLGLANRVRFLSGTWPEGGRAGAKPPATGDGHGSQRRPGSAEPRFDLIVANLPYVAEPEWPTLPPEVREWEPREALLAGPDGLNAIRAVVSRRVRGLLRYPKQNANSARGALALEVGEGQAAAVGTLLREAGFESIEARRDVAGIERVVIGEATASGESDPGESDLGETPAVGDGP